MSDKQSEFFSAVALNATAHRIKEGVFELDKENYGTMSKLLPNLGAELNAAIARTAKDVYDSYVRWQADEPGAPAATEAMEI